MALFIYGFSESNLFIVMIQIVQNTENTVYLDLTSNSNYWINSGITPYFLFSFTSDTTQQVINFVSDNIAVLSARTRYDEFIITETGSTYTNFTAGTINLPVGNFWTYSVYEQFPDQYNLDPSQALDMVTTGRVFYTPNSTAGYVYYENTGSTNNFFYNTNY